MAVSCGGIGALEGITFTSSLYKLLYKNYSI